MRQRRTPVITTSACRRQAGMSMWALLVIAILLVIVGGAGLKAAPSVIEHMAIQSALAEAARETTPKAIRDIFQRQADVNDITSITNKDLLIEPVDGGGLKVSYQYEKQIPLAGPVSLLIDYKGEAKQ
ncbi:MAG: DUF4845 domain-containing protein [Burkholderiaceae bacterium]